MYIDPTGHMHIVSETNEHTIYYKPETKTFIASNSDTIKSYSKISKDKSVKPKPKKPDPKPKVKPSNDTKAETKPQTTQQNPLQKVGNAIKDVYNAVNDTFYALMNMNTASTFGQMKDGKLYVYDWQADLNKAGADVLTAEIAGGAGGSVASTVIKDSSIILSEGAGSTANVSKKIISKINAAIKSTNKGKQLEGQVAKELGNEVVEFNKMINTPNGTLGEIDIETTNAIIEVTSGKVSKNASEFSKYFGNVMNPNGKKVILYAPELEASRVTDIEKVGVTVVQTMEELKNVLK